MLKRSTIMTIGWCLLMLMSITPFTMAQEATEEPLPPLPSFYQLDNLRYEAQTWNNCGPATLTSALSFFGYADGQQRAADWLKPNYEDKNVSPNQMVRFVNEQVPELPVYAKLRYAGTLEGIKRLVANDFPVIIEKGYDPEPDRLGWMGHYLFVTGYDDARQVFITNDSYIGSNIEYSYDYIEQMWQHFNYTYIVLYTVNREMELDAILGDDADERTNIINALEVARQQAAADNSDAFAWFNMGTNFVLLEMYAEAAIAYDEARKVGLPWRMLWYQFGPFEAYYQVGRYDDVLALAQANLNDGGGQYVEETYYYGALARWAKGETDRARSNLQYVLQFNPNFWQAQELQVQLGG
jgi:hypothetical protein